MGSRGACCQHAGSVHTPAWDQGRWPRLSGSVTLGKIFPLVVRWLVSPATCFTCSGVARRTGPVLRGTSTVERPGGLQRRGLQGTGTALSITVREEQRLWWESTSGGQVTVWQTWSSVQLRRFMEESLSGNQGRKCISIDTSSLTMVWTRNFDFLFISLLLSIVKFNYSWSFNFSLIVTFFKKIAK